MNTKLLYGSIVCGMFLLSFAIVGEARAQTPDEGSSVQFPIAQLGNCGSKQECKVYCDESEHMEACIAFAEENNLMPKKEIEHAKKFLAAGAKGPGGCTGKKSCEAYCSNPDNIEACVAYAEESGMMDEDELGEARKVRDAIRRGVKPPACGGKEACDVFCESPENMPACIEFASAAGLMSEEDQRNAQQMLQAIKSGAKPPACRGRQECDAYCSQDEHFDECFEFGKAAGFMTEQESEMMKKTRGKGPGGCRGKEACDAFCTSSPENENLCINFQVENGLMSEERKREMEEGSQRFRESFGNMPPEVASCLKEKVGAEAFEKIKSGGMRPDRTIGAAMPECFKRFEEQRTQDESQKREQIMPRTGSGENGYNGPRPPEGTYPQPTEGMYQRPPEGEFRCEGDTCRPPEGTYPRPPEGTYPPIEGGYRPPEGAYRPTEGTYSIPEGVRPPAEGVAPYPQMPPPTEGSRSGSFGEPTTIVAPAPTTIIEPAPAPEPSAPSSPITPESLSGAVILFFQSFSLRK